MALLWRYFTNRISNLKGRTSPISNPAASGCMGLIKTFLASGSIALGMYSSNAPFDFNQALPIRCSIAGAGYLRQLSGNWAISIRSLLASSGIMMLTVTRSLCISPVCSCTSFSKMLVDEFTDAYITGICLCQRATDNKPPLPLRSRAYFSRVIL
jgi:hypothetical protein